MAERGMLGLASWPKTSWPKMLRAAAVGASGLVAALLLAIPGRGLLRMTMAEEKAVTLPLPKEDLPAQAAGPQVAVLAGGCFWGVQAVFQHVKGVQKAVSGYAGGDAKTAHYELVGSGMTGHAEAVEVTFDPRQISYGQILRVFFSVAHDPTQLDRQGPDFGPQYRSGVFATDAAQARVAQAYIAQLDAARLFPAKIATRVDPLTRFYPAEAYHQDYLLQHPDQPYIVYNDLPKLENLKRTFPQLVRDAPVRVAATATK